MSPIRSILLLLILAILPPKWIDAQQILTAYKTGEVTTGMTKQCIYDALGNSYTKTIKSLELCPLTVKVRSPSSLPSTAPTTTPNPFPTTPAPVLITAFKAGERTTGMTKQCFYEALGSAYTKTIGSTALCPLSIRVRQRH